MNLIDKNLSDPLTKESGRNSILLYSNIRIGVNDLVEIFKALGDENRMRIINVLLPGELCVCEIEYLLNMTQTNVSRHLKILKTARVIERNKQAQWIHYRISESFKEHNSELMRYIENNVNTVPECLADTENYRKYRESGCGCAQVRKIMRGE